MCGITGAVLPGEAPPDLAPALGLLAHRGPDAQGLYKDAGGVIGQTRLAVIDLVTGDPPITNEDGTIGAVLNGEIYNYRSLREDLRSRGHRFRTEGDTEVLAHLAEDLEPAEIARRLDGMFAFAVYDTRRRRLILGRDRLGKKPLYYWRGSRAFVFASEIKAVLAHPRIPRRLDPGAIPAYLTFGYVPTPRTFYEGVESVPPGHVVAVDEDGGVTLARYWEPPLPGRPGIERLDATPDELARHVRALLAAAVRRRLVADVPLGVFLSGGIDSSSVVALMAEAGSGPVTTFTIGFEDEDGFDERPYARLVARRFGTDHLEFVVRPDAAALVEQLVWHHDQPFGDSSALPMYLLSELTRRHVTVALCGDGGDELFAGYERFAAALAITRLERLSRPGRSLLRWAASVLPQATPVGRAASLRRFVTRLDLPVPLALLSFVTYVPDEWRRQLLEDPSDWAIAAYLGLWEESAGAPLLDRLLDLNLRTYLLDDLLPKVDRMSMAHGLEVRSPFLDQELLEFALRLPRAARLRGLSLKRVLKGAMRGFLPDEILGRRKHGFGIPLDRWFRTDLRPCLEGTVGSRRSRLRDHLDPEAIDQLLDEHIRGRANHGHALWALLTLELFLRREGW